MSEGLGGGGGGGEFFSLKTKICRFLYLGQKELNLRTLLSNFRHGSYLHMKSKVL